MYAFVNCRTSFAVEEDEFDEVRGASFADASFNILPVPSPIASRLDRPSTV